MKIISKTKDYYDWVAGKYGGGDPLVVYDRRQHSVGNNEYIAGVNFSAAFDIPYKDGNIGICSLCAEPYYVIREDITDPWRLLLSIDDPLFQQRFTEVTQTYRYYRPNIERVLLGYKNHLENHTQSPRLLAISREIKRPVFIFTETRYEEFEVVEKIPNLSELGFASILSAEQMYQKLAYFISNLLNESPDLSPPVQISDKDKIRQHGFDLKRSFRK